MTEKGTNEPIANGRRPKKFDLAGERITLLV